MKDKTKYIDYWIVEPTKKGGIKKRIKSGSHTKMLKSLNTLKLDHPEYRVFEMISYISKDVTEKKPGKLAENSNSIKQ